MIRQELSPVTCKTSLDCRYTSMAGQWMLPSLMHSFVGQSSIRELCPPALLVLEGERTEGRKKREVLHLFRCYTHTCSETSYRITDVECISRAKTPHLSLTGEFGMILRGNQCEVNFLRPCSEESSDAAQSTMSDQIKKQLFHLTMSAVNQIAKNVQAQKTECCGIE